MYIDQVWFLKKLHWASSCDWSLALEDAELPSLMLWTNTAYCKLFEVEKFFSFHRSISNRETFPVSNRLWPYKATV